jgi:hypothetical protein
VAASSSGDDIGAWVPVQLAIVQAFAQRRYKLWVIMCWATAGLMLVGYFMSAYITTRDGGAHERIAALEYLHWLQYVAPLGLVGLVFAVYGYRRYSTMRDALEVSGVSCRLVGQTLFITNGSTSIFRLMKRDIVSLLTPTVPSARATLVERGGK